MMTNAKNKKAIISLLVIIALIGLVLIYFMILKKDVYEVQEISVSSDIVITEDIEEMARESDVVVIGYFGKMTNKINTQRDFDDILKESPYGYSEGHIYEFEVAEVIAGDLNENNIPIVIAYSYEADISETEEEKKITIIEYLYREPKLGQKYVLFLKHNEILGHYFGATVPYTLTVNEEDVVKLDSILAEGGGVEAQIVRLEETKEEFHIYDELFNDTIEDNISGKTLSEIKETIKENFNR